MGKKRIYQETKYKALDLDFVNKHTIPEQFDAWVKLNGKNVDSIINFLGPVNARLIATLGVNGEELPKEIEKECLEATQKIACLVSQKQWEEICDNWPNGGPLMARVAFSYLESIGFVDDYYEDEDDSEKLYS